MTELIAMKGNTHSRLLFEYRHKKELGVQLALGYSVTISHENIIKMQIQYDVLSVDTANDNSYTLIDSSQIKHENITKTDYENAMFEYKVGAFQLWQEKENLLSQIETCTNQIELDALQFT